MSPTTDGIPDTTDQSKPRPIAGELRLSEAAIDQRNGRRSSPTNPNPKNLTLQPSSSNSNGSNSITVTRVILEMVVVVVVKTLTLKPSPKKLNLTT